MEFKTGKVIIQYVQLCSLRKTPYCAFKVHKWENIDEKQNKNIYNGAAFFIFQNSKAYAFRGGAK